MGEREKELAQLVEDMKVTNQTQKVLRSRWKGLKSLFKRKRKKNKAIREVTTKELSRFWAKRDR